MVAARTSRQVGACDKRQARIYAGNGTAILFAKSLALLAASPFRALGQLAATGSPAIASYPIYVALGRTLAEFGYANEQYRQPEKN